MFSACVICLSLRLSQVTQALGSKECVSSETVLSETNANNGTMTENSINDAICHSFFSASYSHSPPNTAQDAKTSRPHSGSLLTHYSPLPPIHMPKLRQESRSGKSRDSDTVTRSEAGTPLTGTKFEDARPSTQGTVDEHDTHIRLVSPEILPVR